MAADDRRYRNMGLRPVRLTDILSVLSGMRGDSAG